MGYLSIRHKASVWIWRMCMPLARVGRRFGILNLRVGHYEIANVAYGLLARLLPAGSKEVQATLPWATMLVPLWHLAATDYITGSYEKETRQLFETLVKQGMTVVDVGAHLGYYTLLSARLVGPSGRVYAFEPDPRYHEFLLRSLQLNDFRNVEIAQKAVSNRTGLAPLFSDPRGGGGRLFTNLPYFTRELVQTVTLDQFFADKGWPAVHLVKLDIEGGEERALRGMRELNERNPPLKLIIELAPAPMRLAGVRVEDVAALLSDMGFKNGYVIGNERKTLPVPEGLSLIYEQLPKAGGRNILCEKESRR